MNAVETTNASAATVIRFIAALPKKLRAQAGES
jgi:hypothetical protein